MSFSCCYGPDCRDCDRTSPDAPLGRMRDAATDAGWWEDPAEDGRWLCPEHRPDSAAERERQTAAIAALLDLLRECDDMLVALSHCRACRCSFVAETDICNDCKGADDDEGPRELGVSKLIDRIRSALARDGKG